ncbi:MAG: DUF3793 family protein [Synergistaceae bacterium]|nr:DUF3793 family protein [Synergistaceae bacterium]
MNRQNANIIKKFMERIKNFDNENFIKSILFCFSAPTIKGIKAACLINFKRENEDIKTLWKENADKWLNPLGVQWLLLNDLSENKNAIVLIYRRELLARVLGCDKACEILKARGYPLDDLDACLTCLRKNFSASFPHEIGLFLDYPPYDVKCFMENKKCENQLREGCYWKVYGDVKKARQTFRKYRQAECDTARLILTGK